MNRFTKFLFKFRIVVIAVVFAIAGLCVWLTTQVKVNSDISSYLPADSTVAETMEFLDKTFGIKGDAVLVLESGLDDFAEVEGVINEIYGVKDVSDEGMWLGAAAQMGGGADAIALLYTPDAQLTDEQQTAKSVLMSLAPTFYKGTVEGDCYKKDQGYYLVYLSLEVPSNDQRAFDAMDGVSAVLQKSGADYHLGGTAMETKAMMESALSDIPKFVIIAVCIIFVILLLTTKSFVDPFVFLLTIGVSIIINMGTNIIFPSVSSVTYAAATILQLALAMDYSIFLTHAYNAELAECGNELEAMGRALKKTLLTVSASALTTIAGFCALFAMRFTLGFDLGMVLAKGVLLSLISVCLFQPCVILCLRKLIAKTNHRFLQSDFKKLYKAPSKCKYVFVAAAVVLLGITFYGQMHVDYYYLTTEYNQSAVGAQDIYQQLGSRQVIVVPDADDELKQAAFLADLKGLKDENGNAQVKDVMSAPTFLQAIYKAAESEANKTTIPGQEPVSINSAEDLQDLITRLDGAEAEIYATVNAMIDEMGFGGLIQVSDLESFNDLITMAEQFGSFAGVSPEQIAQLKAARDLIVRLPQSKAALQQILGTVQMINAQFCRTVDGKQYTFYYVYTVGQPESSEALDALGNIHKLYADTFAGQKLLSAGSTQTVMDMEKVTGTDFTVIALLSAAIILVIIAVVFRSVWKAIIVTLVIELGIFINLSLNVVFGMTINFVTYIIISAIQLGATVDYAILLTNKYREARLTERDNTKAVGKAMSQSVFSIIISVAILVSACMSVFLFSGDPIIREITMMIARGSFISGLLVVFLLPAIYMLLYGKSKKTDDDGGKTERQNRDAADTETQ